MRFKGLAKWLAGAKAEHRINRAAGKKTSQQRNNPDQSPWRLRADKDKRQERHPECDPEAPVEKPDILVQKKCSHCLISNGTV